MSTAATNPDIRAQLTSELKDAMKSKNLLKSTTIRSVLSDVYAADKAAESGNASSSAILGILKKATTRRTDAAAEFLKASRADLAEKEQKEAEILQAFLPSLLPESEVDRVLADIIADPAVASASGPPQKVLGQVFKAFYAKVDKNTVDADLVRRRAQTLLAKDS